MTPENVTSAENCILVVEDDVDARETLCEIVEMAGCSAVGAANGREALEVLAERRPCLVILDLMMPIMSGHELLEQMQRRPELAEVPVVISTSAPHKAPAHWPVIPKPIDIAKVVEWLERTCHCVQPRPRFSTAQS
jgi:CheY-like chemotaxis protein